MSVNDIGLVRQRHVFEFAKLAELTPRIKEIARGRIPYVMLYMTQQISHGAP